MSLPVWDLSKVWVAKQWNWVRQHLCLEFYTTVIHKQQLWPATQASLQYQNRDSVNKVSYCSFAFNVFHTRILNLSFQNLPAKWLCHTEIIGSRLLLLCTSAPLVLCCDRFMVQVDLVRVNYDITLRWPMARRMWSAAQINCLYQCIM